MKLSIIVPSLPKNQDYLTLCQNSIIQNTEKAFDYEIIVAENGEGTDYPQGQCKAVNREARKANGEWLLITNDDMYFPKGWDKLLSFDEFNCFVPNCIEPVEIASPTPFLKLNAGQTLETFNREMVDDYVTSNNEKIVEIGFNLPFFIRKSLWDFIGGYDEAYDPWGSNSDSDLLYKCVLAGVYPKRNRGMLIYHFGSKSGTYIGGTLNPATQAYWQRNYDYFIQKWGFPRANAPTIWYKIEIPKEQLKFNPTWRKK